MRRVLALAFILLLQFASLLPAQSDALPPPRLLRRLQLVIPPPSGPRIRTQHSSPVARPLIKQTQFVEPTSVEEMTSPVSLEQFISGDKLGDILGETRNPTKHHPYPFPQTPVQPDLHWQRPVIRPAPETTRTPTGASQQQAPVSQKTSTVWLPVQSSLDGSASRSAPVQEVAEPAVRIANAVPPPPPEGDLIAEEVPRSTYEPPPIFEEHSLGAWQPIDSLAENNLSFYGDAYYEAVAPCLDCWETPPVEQPSISQSSIYEPFQPESCPCKQDENGCLCVFEDDEIAPFLTLGMKAGNDRSISEIQAMLPLWQNDLNFVFGDLRGRFYDDEASDGHFGLGYRTLIHPEWIFGVYGYYDLRKTTERNRFNQFSAGLELMSPDWDIRLNGYFPNVNAKSSSRARGVSNGTIITNAFAERASTGYNFEVGRRILHWGRFDTCEVRWFAGYFYFDNDASGFAKLSGPRTRVEFRTYDLAWLGVQSRITAGVEYSYDNLRDDQYWGFLRVQIPFAPEWSRSLLDPVRRRMADVPYRDVD